MVEKVKIVTRKKNDKNFQQTNCLNETITCSNKPEKFFPSDYSIIHA